MADGVFNIAKGRVVEYYNRVENNDPAAAVFEVQLWAGTDIADDLLNNQDDVAAIQATTLTIATFTNYASKIITDTILAALPAPDDTANRFEVIMPDQTWTAAGNGLNDTLVRMTIAYDALGTSVDSGMIPCTFYDFDVLTDGSDLTAQFDALGFFRAA